MDRGTYMGSGDAGVCCGLSKHGTPQTLTQEKQARRVGNFEEPSPSLAMMFGSFNQQFVIEQFQRETGLSVTDSEKFFRHPTHDFIGCHVDGLTMRDGVPCIVEAKTTALYWDEIPDVYIAQVQQQLACTGYELAFMPVLRQGRQFEIFEIEADPMYQDFVISKMVEVWQHVLNDTLPPALTHEDIKSRYPDADGSVALAAAEDIQNANELASVKKQIKELEDQQAVLEMSLKSKMKESDDLITEEGDIIATWKNSKGRSTFDHKRFKEDHPDLHDDYLRSGSSFRTFRLKVR